MLLPQASNPGGRRGSVMAISDVKTFDRIERHLKVPVQGRII
jgi:hypothetical protein